ncbi:MAG: excinuclease ABC subunit UvrC [Candidatus Omnitrophica bacterium]|nr:excinuclease ABC subunit UvrC [Candidatus Omnitrophota bacterium]
MTLKQKIAGLPDAPGVYLMKDSSGKIIYIGKANSLRKRVSNYLGRDLSSKTVALMSNVADIEYRLTPTESLALLLEASLVHQFKPKYNVLLRDDKSFPMVKITNEEFPAIYITRKKENDGAIYLGPYTGAALLKAALEILRKCFPYRTCRKLPKRACIYYRIGLSPAPCIGKISKSDYAKTVNNIRLILEGRAEELVKKLSRQMNICSKEHKYEEAAQLRDQINALSSLGSIQAGNSRQFELDDLKNLLKLETAPERIEAFDISNISGKEACGSMVSFYKGTPDKSNYRRFRIKTVKGVDDYGMIKEIVYRRYSRLIQEKLPLPDLILIDGGKAHLAVADSQLSNLRLNIPLMSIAKDRENIYTRYKVFPIKLKSDTPALNLIRRVRDEAHRFAVAYHHVLRRKKVIGK